MKPENTMPGAVDFTSQSGLSMSDSLASAQDNLTSAGLAAKDVAGPAIGLDQIGAAAPSATMARPEEPLIPAAPVPGSIGSAISGPAPMNPAAAMAPTEAPAAGNLDVQGTLQNLNSIPAGADPLVAKATAQNQAVITQPMGAGTSFGQAMSGAAGFGTPGNVPGAAPANAPAGLPFNPFVQNGTTAASANPMAEASAAPTAPVAPAMSAPAANAGGMTMPNMAQKSSTSVPMGLQPKTEKYGGKEKKKIEPLTVILGAVAGVMTVLAIVFFCLWLGAKDKEKIVYVPAAPSEQEVPEPVDTTVVDSVMEMSWSSIEGLEGLDHTTKHATFTFGDEVLTQAGMTDTYYFVDNGAAENARGRFDELVASWNGMVAGQENTTFAVSYEVIDATVVMSYSVEGEADIALVASAFALPAGEDDVIDKSKAGMEAAFTGYGFSWSVIEETTE